MDEFTKIFRVDFCDRGKYGYFVSAVGDMIVFDGKGAVAIARKMWVISNIYN